MSGCNSTDGLPRRVNPALEVRLTCIARKLSFDPIREIEPYHVSALIGVSMRMLEKAR